MDSTRRERNIAQIDHVLLTIHPDYKHVRWLDTMDIACFTFSPIKDGEPDRTTYLARSRADADLSPSEQIDVIRDLLLMLNASEECMGVMTITTTLRECGYTAMVDFSGEETRVYFGSKHGNGTFFIAIPPSVAKELAGENGWGIAKRTVEEAIRKFDTPPPPKKVG